MRIALVAHIRHPIAPPFRGGMEAHAHTLAGALHERGHDVTLFASGDSRPPPGVRLEPIVAEHYDLVFPWHRFHGTDRLNAHLDAAFEALLPRLRHGGFDVIHNNSLHRYPPRAGRMWRLPMVTSLHVPPFDALRRAVHESVAPWCRVTACSAHHLAQWWPDGAPPWAEVVHNGIDTRRWPFVPHGDGTAIWTGRITPTKGTGQAVAAARLAGVPLRIFGPIEHRDYFDQTVAPRLGPWISHAGNLDQAELAGRIGCASVALVTPCWDEPFGLTAIEAMACGVPIAGFDRGALREVAGDAAALVPEGDTVALAGAIRRAMTTGRAAQRDRVERLFASGAMVAGYESLYAAAIAARAAHAPATSFAEIELPRSA